MYQDTIIIMGNGNQAIRNVTNTTAARFADLASIFLLPLILFEVFMKQMSPATVSLEVLAFTVFPSASYILDNGHSSF